MNTKLTLFTVCFLSILISGCSSDDSPFTEGGSSSNNIVSAKNFVLVFSELNPQVYETLTGTLFTGIEVTITANAGDRFNAAVTGGTVEFRTELGLLSNDSCELVNGSCSVTWTSVIEIADLTADRRSTVTAFMRTGEEGFLDLNGNFIFDDGDSLTHDESDPFLDLSHDGSPPTYNVGIDALIIDTTFTAADGRYSGTGCVRTVAPLCATATSVPIFDTQEMLLSF